MKFEQLLSIPPLFPFKFCFIADTYGMTSCIKTGIVLFHFCFGCGSNVEMGVSCEIKGRNNKCSGCPWGNWSQEQNHGFSMMELEMGILILVHCSLSQFFSCWYFCFKWGYVCRSLYDEIRIVSLLKYEGSWRITTEWIIKV